MSDLTSLPDRLLEAAHPYAEVTLAQMAGLLTEASDRICELEEQLLKARSSSALADRLRQVADTDAQLMAGRFLPEAHDEGCWRRHGRCAVQRAADLLDGGQ